MPVLLQAQTRSGESSSVLHLLRACLGKGSGSSLQISVQWSGFAGGLTVAASSWAGLLTLCSSL